jgi:hypothetical protein
MVSETFIRNMDLSKKNFIVSLQKDFNYLDKLINDTPVKYELTDLIKFLLETNDTSYIELADQLYNTNKLKIEYEFNYFYYILCNTKAYLMLKEKPNIYKKTYTLQYSIDFLNLSIIDFKPVNMKSIINGFNFDMKSDFKTLKHYSKQRGPVLFIIMESEYYFDFNIKSNENKNQMNAGIDPNLIEQFDILKTSKLEKNKILNYDLYYFVNGTLVKPLTYMNTYFDESHLLNFNTFSDQCSSFITFDNEVWFNCSINSNTLYSFNYVNEYNTIKANDTFISLTNVIHDDIPMYLLDAYIDDLINMIYDDLIKKKDISLLHDISYEKFGLIYDNFKKDFNISDNHVTKFIYCTNIANEINKTQLPYLVSMKDPLDSKSNFVDRFKLSLCGSKNPLSIIAAKYYKMKKY